MCAIFYWSEEFEAKFKLKEVEKQTPAPNEEMEWACGEGRDSPQLESKLPERVSNCVYPLAILHILQLYTPEYSYNTVSVCKQLGHWQRIILRQCT